MIWLVFDYLIIIERKAVLLRIFNNFDSKYRGMSYES